LEIVCDGVWGLELEAQISRHCTATFYPLLLVNWSGRTVISKPIKEQSVSSVKDAMIDIIGRQPEDSTYDEILRELAYARMVQRGMDDADAGRTVPDSDVRRKIESWQK
jgi:predicted transcriptional regulator